MCGSRTWEDVFPIYTFIKGVAATHSGHKVVVAHGGAQGADTMAGHAAVAADVEVRVFPANWKEFGKAAGFIRNKQMVEEFKPDIVVACSEYPVTTGTQHTVNLAVKAGLPVYLLSHGLGR